ncbi:hypothetical protein BQ8794_60121 [Mesorhizobium prunaredense]|uniref:Transposase n=1 Tax=Mesorhizobium prunaredense TaxID=1631249 RepID=A0A1R3VFW0_9HYPH|nr:hypothetical protein BQ8794_60121 [Mesorhizobium prunaredense]
MRMRVWRMRTGIFLTVSSIDRQRLGALIRDRNAPQKHVWRAEIILLSSDGVGTVEIMRQTGKSKTCVWRWQERFAAEGFERLLRDKTRPSRIAPLGPEVAERVVALALQDPPLYAHSQTASLRLPILLGCQIRMRRRSRALRSFPRLRPRAIALPSCLAAECYR